MTALDDGKDPPCPYTVVAKTSSVLSGCGGTAPRRGISSISNRTSRGGFRKPPLPIDLDSPAAGGAPRPRCGNAAAGAAGAAAATLGAAEGGGGGGGAVGAWRGGRWCSSCSEACGAADARAAAAGAAVVAVQLLAPL